MKKNFISILSLSLLLNCAKEENPSIQIPDGNYTGTFQRDWVWSNSDTANVSITFTTGEWEGTSDIQKYPALCKGTYTIQGDTIIFVNECAWTQEFDNSLVLSGKYHIKQSNNEFEITRDDRSETSDTYIDRYILKRKTQGE
jgi:hypothetical protein